MKTGKHSYFMQKFQLIKECNGIMLRQFPPPPLKKKKRKRKKEIVR